MVQETMLKILQNLPLPSTFKRVFSTLWDALHQTVAEFSEIRLNKAQGQSNSSHHRVVVQLNCILRCQFLCISTLHTNMTAGILQACSSCTTASLYHAMIEVPSTQERFTIDQHVAGVSQVYKCVHPRTLLLRLKLRPDQADVSSSFRLFHETFSISCPIYFVYILEISFCDD